MTRNFYSPYKLVNFPEKIKALREKRITPPLYVRIKPTNKCDAACRWCCYKHGDEYDATMHDSVDLRDVIPNEKLIHIVDDLAEFGVKAITFTGGGEPLIHPAIVDAMRHVVEGRMALSIITNAQRLSGPRAEVLLFAAWVRASVDYWDGPSMHECRGVTPDMFAVVDANLREFAKVFKGDLGINYIITKANHERLVDSAMWLKDCGVGNIRFSPVWQEDFVGYHAGIQDVVENQLAECKALEEDGFKVYSSYYIDPHAKERMFDRCCFQEITPVIGADQVIYRCKDQSYSAAGALASIKDQAFSKAWMSNVLRDRIFALDPHVSCRSQCAAENKNRIYENFLEASDDAFI